MSFGLILLAVLAGAFALGGLRKTSKSTSRNETSESLFKQRQAELSAEVEDASNSEELRVEASRSLLADLNLPVAEEEQLAVDNWASSRKLVLMLATAIPLVAGLWFWALSDPGLTALYGAEEVMGLQESKPDERARLEHWKGLLETRVSTEPEDEKSLYLLAHTRLKLADFGGAAQAFASASMLNPEDKTIKVYWLQARFLSARGTLDKMSTNLANEILQGAPNIPVVLEILAMDAVRRGDAEQAVRHLSRALSAARDGRNQMNFVAAINELRKEIDLPGVSVVVSADNNVPQDATLFVIARPVGGGMPLAVVKMPAVLVPQTVRLDDLVSMSDVLKLSSQEEFELVVRISLTGTPMAQPGDWEWSSGPLSQPLLDPISVQLSPPK
jgi:cytochrome c-type biogenesis protein CcmH